MKILRFGDAGQDVATLCAKLVQFDYLPFKMVAHRVFDRVVKRAVLDFQARHLDPTGQPLVSDGVVGSLTWWALDHPKHHFIGKPLTWQDIPKVDLRSAHAVHVGALRTAFAEMEAGAQEIGKNNSGEWVKKYIHGIVDLPANWCAGLFSWCWWESVKTMTMPFHYSLGARDIRQQFARKGWAYEPGEKDPLPGDAVFWWRGRPDGWMGHIGFVVMRQNGILYTLEGNKGPFPAPVRTFSYVESRMEKILGFGRMIT